MQNYITECYSLYKRRQIAIRFTFPMRAYLQANVGTDAWRRWLRGSNGRAMFALIIGSSRLFARILNGSYYPARRLSLLSIARSFGVLYLSTRVGRILRYTFTIATGRATVKAGSPVRVSIARNPAG